MAQVLVPASAERAELVRLNGLQADLIELLVEFFRRHAEDGRLAEGDPVGRAGAFAGLCLGASYVHLTEPVGLDEARARARRVVRRFFEGEGLRGRGSQTG